MHDHTNGVERVQHKSAGDQETGRPVVLATVQLTVQISIDVGRRQEVCSR